MNNLAQIIRYFIGIALFSILLFCNNCRQSEIDKIQISDALSIDKYEVTVGQFAQFVKATNYVTTADSIGWSAVFLLDQQKVGWNVATDANWLRKDGIRVAQSSLPVTHMSYRDACAYCEWVGGRLPTAVEWDVAAGDNIIRGNTWEGVFPVYDSGKDGYRGEAAPVGSFIPNQNGIHDMFGNVWEWTSTTDSSTGGSFFGSGNIAREEPIVGKIIKGGSFLCDLEICSGFIPEKYQIAEVNSGLNHLGFRCMYDLSE